MNNYYFEDIEYHLSKLLKPAHSRIVIAVAWFTNPRLANILIEKKDLLIEIVVDDNEINRGSAALKEISFNSITVSFIKDLEKKYYFMHNKFCVIDNQILITGSYNWTNQANLNNENIVVVDDVEAAAVYMREFRSISEGDFSDREVSFSKFEVNCLTNSCYDLIKTELKTKFCEGELKSGGLLNYQNEHLKNAIRVIDEKISIEILKRPSVFHMEKYFYLVKKYGDSWYEKYSSEDLIEIRNNLRKSNIRNHEQNINYLFNQFKIRALDKLLNNYRLKLKTDTDEIRTSRIMRVFQYIVSERNQIIKLNYSTFGEVCAG